jgi:hypothetical protein
MKRVFRLLEIGGNFISIHSAIFDPLRKVESFLSGLPCFSVCLSGSRWGFAGAALDRYPKLLQYRLGSASGGILPAMQLQALSIGEAVPRGDFEAVVQSAFDSAVNLRLADEDRLITLLISEGYELPQGIRIWTETLSLQTLTPGLRAVARDGILRFDSSPLTVDMRGAPIWKCRVPELDLNMGLLAAQQAWSAAWDLLNKEQRLKNADLVADDLLQTGRGSSLSQRIGRPAMSLITSVDEFDTKGAIRSARQMIGLGPGVTPSGDDILIGFLAGLWSVAGESREKLTFIRSFCAELMRLTRQTSEISRTYLFHAAQGQLSSSLSHLAEAMATGKSVEEAVQTAIRVGHSSGMDSVTGLLIGLCVWNTESPSPRPFTQEEDGKEVT